MADRITLHCDGCGCERRFWTGRRMGKAFAARCMTCGYVLLIDARKVTA